MMRKSGCLIARATPGVNWVMKSERLLALLRKILSLNSSDTVSDGVTARRPCVGGAYSRSRPTRGGNSTPGTGSPGHLPEMVPPSDWGGVASVGGLYVEGFSVDDPWAPPGTAAKPTA